MDVRVGDVVTIHNRESVPADIAMLSCSNPKGMCFVMTSNLDGETNLKARLVNQDIGAAASDNTPGSGGGRDSGGGIGHGPSTQVEEAEVEVTGRSGVLGLAAQGAFVECDLPNQKLEHFDGTLVVRGIRLRKLRHQPSSVDRRSLFS